jgi:hypothetical protein
MESQEHPPVGEPGVIQQITAVDAFKQDGVIIAQKVFQQLAIAPGTDDVRQLMRKTFMTFPPGVVFHFCTVGIQLNPLAPPVFKAM